MDLVWALPKGRILKEAAPLLRAAGLDTTDLDNPGRRLVVPLGEGHRGLLLKPWDVATYVELGVAQLGMCGSDVIRERNPEVYEPLDLGIGACRLVLAAPEGAQLDSLRRPLRVASKYPASARRYYDGIGANVDIITLSGSVELGAVTGLADVVVDLVSTGATLRENRLAEITTIAPVSTRLVVNGVALRLDAARIGAIIRAMEGAMTSSHDDGSSA